MYGYTLYDIPALQAIWQITANHGGGYQYRLCPASEKITEECFQKNPLRFDTSKQVFIDDLSTYHCFCIFQALQWNNGTRMPIRGTFVSEGTVPEVNINYHIIVILVLNASLSPLLFLSPQP